VLLATNAYCNTHCKIHNMQQGHTCLLGVLAHTHTLQHTQTNPQCNTDTRTDTQHSTHTHAHCETRCSASLATYVHCNTQCNIHKLKHTATQTHVEPPHKHLQEKAISLLGVLGKPHTLQHALQRTQTKTHCNTDTRTAHTHTPAREDEQPP